MVAKSSMYHRGMTDVRFAIALNHPATETAAATHEKARRGFPHRKSGSSDLRTKHADLGQARDQCTLREFQFHE
jgi:hypothetical protein